MVTNSDAETAWDRGSRRAVVRGLLVVGIIGALVVGGFFGLRWYLVHKMPHMKYNPMVNQGGASVEGGLDTLGGMMHITFPPNARLTDSSLSIWFGPTLFARIELPAHEVEDLIAAIPEPQWRSTEQRYDIPESFLKRSWPWWRPYAPDEYVAIRAQPPLMEHNQSNMLIMVIDTHGEETAIAYLHWLAE